MKLCRWLRTKALMGRDGMDAEAVRLALTFSDTPFSCLHTCAHVGPDDELVAPEDCQPGRDCFEEDGKRTRAELS